jgi:hypothetical protein
MAERPFAMSLRLSYAVAATFPRSMGFPFHG